MKITKETRRDQIIAFIALYTTDHHNAPSTLKIAEHFSISHITVWNHMQRLMAEGRLLQVDGEWKIPKAEYSAPNDL